jgi:hypothetical protein
MKIHPMCDGLELLKARKLHYRTTFQGLPISIENRKGSVRHWTDGKGMEGKTKMLLPYGYVRGTIGADGDHVDVFLGPNKLSRRVWVVNQRAAHVDRRKFDEHKCMLGFDSKEDAKDAYLKHYDRPDFLGSVTEMTIERFKRWLGNGKKKTEPVYKAGPFIGPRGGKWADPKHTIPWKESGAAPRGYSEVSRKEAVQAVIDSIRQNARAGWLRNEDRAYKDEIAESIDASAKLRNATLNILHQQHQIYTGKKVSFAEFLDTPITLHRAGKTPAAEAFSSFSFDKSIAQKFSEQYKAPVETITVKPRDTYGMINEMAEGEVLVPLKTADSGKYKQGEVLEVRGSKWRVQKRVARQVYLVRADKPDSKPMKLHEQRLTALLQRKLQKGGPYIGPRGGKWKDPKHTIPWKEEKQLSLFGRPAKPKKRLTVIQRDPALTPEQKTKPKSEALRRAIRSSGSYRPERA